MGWGREERGEKFQTVPVLVYCIQLLRTCSGRQKSYLGEIILFSCYKWGMILISLSLPVSLRCFLCVFP